MHNLDNVSEIKHLDKGGVLASIEKLPAQMSQAWEDIKNLDVPQACALSKNVVISGMGGSALGGRIVDSLLTERSRAPIEIFTELHLPNYVNKDTLVIISSYSGNTEETLSAAHEALNRGATIFGITTGGKLKEFLQENELAGYVIDPRENPSGQPRMALGYSIMSIMAILAKCGFMDLFDAEVDHIVAEVEKLVTEYGVSIEEKDNEAKAIARKLKNKIPVLIASEHLVGSAHAFKNQLNENAKTFGLLFDLPELNHHLMEGLRNPAEAKSFYHFIFIESDLYSREVKIRYPLTREVVEKNEVATSIYKAKSGRKLVQIFELLALSSYISFYLAMLYGIDPSPIPWVDYFKEKL